MVYDVVFNTDSPNLVFWVSIVVDILLLQTVSIAIASAGVFAAAIYYILQLRHQSKVRQTDLVLRIWQTTCTEEMIRSWHRLLSAEYDDLDDFTKKYGRPFSDNPVPVALTLIGMLHEGLGVSLHRKVIDVDLIREYFAVGWAWEKIKPIAEGLRKERHAPTFHWVEYLYNEVKKRQQQLKKEDVNSG
jgi:hypothetical protein